MEKKANTNNNTQIRLLMDSPPFELVYKISSTTVLENMQGVN